MGKTDFIEWAGWANCSKVETAGLDLHRNKNGRTVSKLT